MDNEMNREETVRLDAPTGNGGWYTLLCSVGASVGIFGGISSLFAGLLCVFIHAVIAGDQVFDHAGTILLILGIPMLLVGSVFLDEIRR